MTVALIKRAADDVALPIDAMDFRSKRSWYVDSCKGTVAQQKAMLAAVVKMIGGFILGGGGGGSTTVVVRALGPSLGLPTTALQDPTLELHDVDGVLIGSNDNWKDTQEAEISAAGLAPADDRDAALLMDLPPGDYTAVVRGKEGTTGVALVEVYRVE